MLGARGYSAEIAHVPMGTLARVCPSCGNHNCLQTDLSRNGFLSKARGELIDWDAPLDTAWGAYVAALEQAEPRAVAAARENAALLARTLSIAQAVTRPQIIMFGGLPRVLYEIIVPFLEAGTPRPRSSVRWRRRASAARRPMRRRSPRSSAVTTLKKRAKA